jgi:NSS family neurotransmitter:Na+ symporter
MKTAEQGRWSSRPAVYLAGIGASVGLGSIWRFPYVAGANGGSAFVFVFILACLAIATPLLCAEFILGRRSRRSPPEAAGAVAADFGGSRAWNVIGVLGTLTSFLIISYYTVIAGWVLAYTWKCASGQLAGLTHGEGAVSFREFLSSPLRLGAWHLAFLGMAGFISARGVNRGIEVANRIRAPGLLLLLMILVVYALLTGDVGRGLSFAFAPDFAKLTPNVLLAAVGQAFYATGVGMSIMIAYGIYVPPGTSLLRTALAISGSIVLVSLFAALMIFPLVYRYGLSPAQGPELVFDILPTAFAQMPGGRLIGSLFFLLLILAALTPTVAGIEPLVSWLEQRGRLSRTAAALAAFGALWIVGIASVLSFNVWNHWYPLNWIGRLRGMTVFDAMDFLTSSAMLPIGALLTCILVGWRLPKLLETELPEDHVVLRRTCRVLLRYVCPIAIGAVLISAVV